MANLVRTGFMIKSELYDGVKEYASENNMSYAAVYNLAIKQFLENESLKKIIFKGFNQEEFLKQAAEAYVKAQASAISSGNSLDNLIEEERKSS